MADLDLSGRALAELDLADDVRTIEPGSPRPWEFWVSVVASASAILVIGGMLLALTAELRAGWVVGHELPMDKAAAIHKLLFRP
ncbi:MAG TPA: hypothetical protein VG328_19875 [Stellaceae bacterium]|jgi:hypothetical protein|nr:hypothetical protein [Stellaceae bacterium]